MIKKKKDIISSLATHGKDVGSTEVQIGLLTERPSMLLCSPASASPLAEISAAKSPLKPVTDVSNEDTELSKPSNLESYPVSKPSTLELRSLILPPKAATSASVSSFKDAKSSQFDGLDINQSKIPSRTATAQF